MNKFVYHRKPKNFQDNYLYSLNELKDIYPESYKFALEKYQGREGQINQPIPGFNTTWNNLIHTSPINPLKVRDALIKAGRKPEDIKPSGWFKIPIEELKKYKVILYKYTGKSSNRSHELIADDFEEFSFDKYQELTEIPDETFKYYQEQIQEEKSPLLFHLIPHVLIEGPLDISNFEVIEVY